MSYTEDQIGILVRRRLGTDPAEVLRYVPLVPAAIEATVRKCARRIDLRNYTLTNPAATTVALDGSGAADLSSLVADPRVMLDLLKYGRITHASYTSPLRFLEDSTHGAFAGSLDSLFPKCWLEGATLKTRVAGEAALSGSLGLAVPYRMTLAQLPDALVEPAGVGLIDSLIDLLSLRPDEEDGD